MTNPARQRLTNPQILELFAERQAKADLNYRARRYSAALISQLHINPYGIDLVCHLSDATCRDNEQAIVRWVSIQLKDEDFQRESVHTSATDVLLLRLQRQIADLTSANW
jgi:hypothetical protein